MRKLIIDTTQFLAASRTLKTDEIGALASIMINAFDITGRGDVSDDDLILSRLAGVSPARWSRMAPFVRDIFRPIDGRLSFRHLLAKSQKVRS